MKRSYSLLILVVFCLPAWFENAPASADPPSAGAKSVEEQLQENPNSTDALNEYMMSQIRRLMPLIDSAPDEAQEILDSMKATLEALEPTENDATQLLGRAREAIGFYEQRMKLARTSLDELRTKLDENPDDAATIGVFIQKVMQQVGPLASSQPAQAEEQLSAAQAFLDDLKDKVESDEGKRALASKDRPFGQLLGLIERTKRLEAMIGTEAAPLSIQAWVNGDPLTDEDLKGKVVLLDFWAVWCGPCIATFPHLRQWQEKYADKGLVIIGLTNYFGYAWDDEAGRHVRPPEKATPEQEQEMLQKFAKYHNLHHRFAIQKDNSLAEFYGVSGIPHVVVIDRESKVQLMRVGSGEAAAKDVGEMIEKLIAEGS